MKERYAYFADENDYSFFGEGTLSKLLIDFNCLYAGKRKGMLTKPYDDVKEVFTEFQKMGYSLYLEDVPENENTLDWLDEKFGFDFCCNNNPCHYADLCDTWTSISRNGHEMLCYEGSTQNGRRIIFEDNWLEILERIKNNDLLARTESVSVQYDDIDWNQKKEPSGVCDGAGNLIGKEFVPVEKMNAKTTALLRELAVPESDYPETYGYKPQKESWSINFIKWDVKAEIASKYGVKIEITQYSLEYRGTWLRIAVKSAEKKYDELKKILGQFCKDYGFDTRKELNMFDGYDLPWTDEQREREKLDDNADFFFGEMDFGEDD